MRKPSLHECFVGRSACQSGGKCTGRGVHRTTVAIACPGYESNACGTCFLVDGDRRMKGV